MGEVIERENILYIDDEQANLDGFRFNFRKEYNIFVAQTAVEGFEIIKQNQIKVVISDQRMPDMLGTEFFEKLSISHPEIIRILVTAFADTDAIMQAINKGKVYRFIVKPWNRNELQVTIDNAIESYNLRHQNIELINNLTVKNKELQELNQRLVNEINVRKKAESELAAHRDNLENIVKQRTEEIEKVNQDLAVAYEDMQASNQELNAINEELAYANEKLSKEITARIQVQEMLAESENKFRGLIEQSSEGIILINDNGIIVECNQSMSTIMGVDANEILNISVWDFDYKFIPSAERTPHRYEHIKKAVQKYLHNIESAQVLNIEDYWETPGKNLRFISTVLFPVITPKGKFLGRIFRDYTEQKQSEEELRKYKEELEFLVKERTNQLQESQQRFLTISDNLPGGAIYHGYTDEKDKDHLIYASASIEKIGGIKIDALKADMSLFFQNIHPDDLEKFIKARAKSQKSLEILDIELRFIRNLNEIQYLHIRTLYKVGTDSNIWWEGYVIDITQRKQAENSLREQENIIKNIQEGIASKTGESLFETISQKLAETLRAEITIIAEINERSSNKIRTLAFCFNHIIEPDFVYSIKDTPFEKVLDEKIVTYIPSVTNTYPEHWFLDIIQAETFIAVPLFDSSGKTIGLMAAIFKSEVENLKFTQQILEIFSSRVGAEMERIKAESVLKEKEIRFRTLFELSPNLTFITKSDGTIIEANSAFIETSGFTKEEVISSNLVKLGILTEDDRNNYLNIIEKNGFFHNKEISFKNKKGDIHYAILSIERVLLNGEVTMLSTATDITERKLAEEAIQQYSDIANNMQVALNVFQMRNIGDKQSFVLIKSNPAANNLMNIELSNFYNKDLFEIFPELISYGLDKILSDVIHTGISYENEEFRFFKKTGEVLFFNAKAFRLPNSCVGLLFEDITKRKKIEQDVKENEERYRALFNNSPDGIHLLETSGTKAGKIISVNSKVLEMLGYEYDEIINMPIEDLMRDLELKDRMKGLEKLFAGETISFITNFYRKNNSFFPVEVTASAISLGNHLYILGIDRDISERLSMENTIKESELKYRLLFENMTNGFALHEVITDEKGDVCDFRYLEANPAYEKLTGLSVKDSIGKTILEINPIADTNWIRTFGEVALKGKHLYYEEYIAEDNKYYDVLAFSPRIGQFALILTDITERKKAEQLIKESEQKLLNIFNSSTDGMLICDYNLNIIQVNNTFLNLLGYNDIKEPCELKPLELITPEYRETTFEICNKIKNGVAHPGIEISMIHQSGKIIPVEMVSKVISHGSEPAIFSIVRDIAERKNLEKRLFETIINTEERERERFAGDLHDEVGPLLSSLKMYISLLSETEDKNKKDYIIPQVQTLIKEAITTIREVSNDLSPHVLNNYGCVAAINSFISLKRDFLSITFSQNIDNKRFNQSAEVVLYRIVKELINNTIKHAEASNIEIKLYEEENFIKLEYTDNGIGFDPSSATENTKGSIGLLNIMSRIKSVDGRYKISSKKGFGFLFELQIPII